MRLKKIKNNFTSNKNYIKKNNNLIHKKIDRKAAFPKKDKKFPKVNDVALYKLRNKKIIEKKNFVKRKKNLNNSLKEIKLVLDNKPENGVMVISREQPQLNKNINSNNTKQSNSSYSPPNINDSSISFTRTFVDPESKLKILDLYYKLHSFDETSKLTGVHSQTIRYWKKTEDSIKEKVQDPEMHNKSSSQLNLETMIVEAKNALKRSLSNNTTSVKSVTRKSRLNAANKSIKKNDKDMSESNNGKTLKQRKSRIKKSDLLNLSNGRNINSLRNSMKKVTSKEQKYSQSSYNSSQPDIDSMPLETKNSLNLEPKYKKMKKSLKTHNNHSSRISSDKFSDETRKYTMKNNNSIYQSSNDPKSLRYIPNTDSFEDVVDQINKLSNVFESENCLESLHDHFLNLQSEHKNKLIFHDSLLPSKDKLQNETFKHIMIDFFQGEYKLLMEINHQYRQLKQKKSKNLNKNVLNLKNYFNGSMHRLLVLKQQLT